MVNKSDAPDNCIHIIIGEKPDVCGYRVEVISKNVDLRNVEAALAAVQSILQDYIATKTDYGKDVAVKKEQTSEDMYNDYIATIRKAKEISDSLVLVDPSYYRRMPLVYELNMRARAEELLKVT